MVSSHLHSLNGTEKAVYAILKQKPDSSREIADKISKTVKTVQRTLNSLGSKQNPVWEVLK